MSRYHDPDISPILDAAATWAQRSLVGDGSVLSDESLWTPAHLAELDAHFVRNLDEGEGDFFGKLSKQLAPASPGARKLMAELLWVLYLFPSNIGALRKRENIASVWQLAGAPLDLSSPALSEGVLGGIGSGGTAFFAAQWREVNFAIGLFTAFKTRSADERTAIVGDYATFVDWVSAQPRDGNRQLRHMLRYLLFPDVVERMSSNGDRLKVLEKFASIPERESRQWSDRKIDEAVLTLRKRLEAEHGTEKIDFYMAPLRERWIADRETVEAPPPKVVREVSPGYVTGSGTAPLNQILFGPPGSGKTYETIERALQILDATLLREQRGNRAALKSRFDALAKVGRVRFVTFHQSFSYEDFVEGVRATTRSDGALQYAVVDGVFKELCQQAGGAPRVLIIDEINRGNVSRIFGELITLIEPSKREGAAEALTVTLPYSKHSFSVPGNVYIIGTMNTADRSLTGLDIALRRRFEFVEMPPQSALLAGKTIEGIALHTLLETMNHRIAALLDRDHQIGHAYFIDLVSESPLTAMEMVFRHKIVPLLQEYFFEDWERIAWVLNDHRKVNAAHRFIVAEEAGGEALFGDDVVADTRARRWRVNTGAFAHAESYRGIIAASGN